jgi:hypothetical protein
MCSRALAASIASVLAATGASTAHAGDPTKVWWTIETDHFVVHYHDPLGDVARRVAAVSERAHANLAPKLGREPDEKTQVVIVDDTDGANGFASVLPRNRITLFATAPIGQSSLNDHDDWLYGLVTHEYTHILHLDTIGGLPRLVNKVLGKTWAPNQIQPRWVIEGLATYEESKLSSSGRVRSTQFDMFVRTAVLDGEQLGLDELTNGPYRFPRGNAAYLYGSKFLQYIFDRYGDHHAGRMSWAFGTNPVPYAINRQIHATVGRPFTELWGDWKAHLRDRYSLQLEAVERGGRRDGRRLTFDTESHLAPEYTRDGTELVWLANDGSSPTRLRAMPVGGNIGDARDVLRVDRIGAWSLVSDGSLVYEQTRQHRRDDDFQDLFHWDRATGKTVRLTHGLRARDPAVSPDGRQVAFIVNTASRTRLAVMPLVPLRRGDEPRIVWAGERFDQVYQPAWSPDGTRLAVSAWRRGGYRDVLIVELATGAVTEVTRDRAIDGDPAWSPDGRLLYFTSDRTGIANIYAHELDSGALWQVSNVIGGAFDPAISPDGTRLAYQGFDTGGYDLFELDVDPTTWTVANPYVDDRPAPTVVRDDEAVVLGPRPYRAIETLRPEAWQAELAASSASGNAVTLRTGGGDVAGFHAWSLGATVALDDGHLNVAGSYGYGRLRIPIRVSAGRNLAERTGYRIDGVSRSYREESAGATLSLAVPTRRTPGSSVSLSGDLDFDRFRLVDVPDDRLDPNDILPRVPLSNYRQIGVALRGGWANTRGFAETLGAVEGHEVSGAIRYDDPQLGATYRTLALNWSYRGYWKLWGETPVATLRYAGGIRVADIDRGDAFGLGHTPNQDVVGSVLGTARVGSTGYLRGYEPRVVSGDVFHLANLEYRQRLWQIERGLATLPFYLRRLHVAGLVDAGAAYDEPSRDAVRASVGGALRLDFVLGYFAPGTIEVGYARGLMSDGIDETWLLLTTTL